jgi:hypothetical protein
MSIKTGTYTTRCTRHPNGGLILKVHRKEKGIYIPMFRCRVCKVDFVTDAGSAILNRGVGSSKTLEEHAMSAMKEFN